MPVPLSSRHAPRLVALAVVAVALLGVAAGCTTTTWDTRSADHPTSTGAQHYATTVAGVESSITDHMSTVGSDLNEWAPSRKDAHSAAVKIVARLGLNRLLDLGFDAQKGGLALPYSDDERTSLTNILVGCINFQEGLLSLLSAYGKLGVAPAECVTEGIGRRGLTQAFAAAYLDGDQPDPFAHNNQLGAGLGALLAECLTPGSDLVPGSPVMRFPSETSGTTTTSPLPVAPTTTDLIPSTTAG